MKTTRPSPAAPAAPAEVTERSLTDGLDDDLREAWARVRRFAVSLGPQRVYASGHSIMFARKICYAFVRPRRSFLELCVFLPRELDEPEVSRVQAVSRSRYAHTVKLTHGDMLESPLTDWLREAYAAVPEG